MKIRIMILLSWVAHTLFGQAISIDRGVYAAGLWCFPLTTDASTYLYLPNEAKLAVNEAKMPQFSFVHYVNSLLDTSSLKNSIANTDGGGVLHFLVTYETLASKIAQAEAALREQLGQEGVQIRGALPFNAGQYLLVSSVLRDGVSEKKIMASGQAPVLEGGRIALSFELSPKNATLLAESFKMTTPDISLVFDLTFSGLSDAFDGLVTVNWSEVAQKADFKADASVFMVSGAVEKSLDDLRKTNAISIQTSGEDTRMEALIHKIVYPKLIELLFEPVPRPTEHSQNELNQLLTTVLQKASSGGYFSANASYKRKLIRQEGSSVLSFNSRRNVERHHFMTFNMGNLYQKYGQDTRFFQTVSLENFAFQKRVIGVMVDGNLVGEFDKLINNITVTLRKTHEDSTTTVREIQLNKINLNTNHFPSMVYGTIGDKDPLLWLNYEYRLKYNFIGGKHYETTWIPQSNAMINVTSPYQRKKVSLDADLSFLEKQQVRAIIVRLEYPFFGEIQQMAPLTLKPKELLKEPFLEMTLPMGAFEYTYYITWILQDHTEKQIKGNSNTTILFVDNIK